MTSARWSRRGLPLLSAAVGTVLVAGCSGSSSPTPITTVTVVASGSGGSATPTGTGSSSPTGTGATTSTTESGSASTSPSASPSPTSTTTLGGACDIVLPIIAVDQAVGKSVVGKTSFIVNKPDATVGQVERLNCQYGIAPVKAGSKVTDAKVEVSVTLYATDAQAAARVTSTEEDWRGQGAVPTTTTVSGHPATILIGYGKPLLVLAVGPRTVAVNLTATVVAAAKLNSALAAIATSALRGAGG